MNKLSKILLFVFAPLFVLSFVFGGVAVASGLKEEKTVEAKTSIAQKLTEIENEEFYVVSNGEVYSNGSTLTSTENKLSFKNNKLVMVFTKGEGTISTTSLKENTEQVVAVISATKAEDGITISTVDAVNDGTIEHSLDAEYTLGKMVTNTEERIKYSNGEFEILSSTQAISLTATAATDTNTAWVANIGVGKMKFSNQTYGKADSTTTGRAFYVTGGTLTLENTKIQKFSVTGSGAAIYASSGIINIQSGTEIANNVSTDDGGGIYSTATVNISGGKIHDNSCGDGKKGAGVAIGTSGTLNMIGGEIYSNTTTNDGGGVHGRNATINISGGAIYSNTAKWGGGVLCLGGSLNISGSVEISSNTATNTSDCGGGVYGYTNCAVTISGGKIKNNTASGQGGGVFINNSGSLTITGGEITGNSASQGGGIFTATSTSISSVTISGNNASNHGGAIYTNNALTITGGTITNNSTSGAGNAIFYDGSNANVSLSNCSISHGTGTGGHLIVSAGGGETMTIGGGTYTPASGTYAFDFNGSTTINLNGNPTITSSNCPNMWVSGSNYIRVGATLTNTYSITKSGITSFDDGDATSAYIAYSTNSTYRTSAYNHISVSNLPTGMILDNGVKKANYVVAKYKLYDALVADGNNLIVNGDFENYYTGYNPGWDTSKNGTLGSAVGFGPGYNGGVSNPSTGYHAHLKDISSSDSAHGTVMEYINENGRWLGTSQGVSMNGTGTYVITFDVYRVSGSSTISSGFYYCRAGATSWNFHAGCPAISIPSTGTWYRFSIIQNIPDYNTSYGVALYIYGYNGGAGTCYVDNVTVNKVTRTMSSTKYNSVITATAPGTREDGGTFAGWSVPLAGGSNNGLNTSTAMSGSSASNIATAITSSTATTTNTYFKSLTAVDNGTVVLYANYSVPYGNRRKVTFDATTNGGSVNSGYYSTQYVVFRSQTQYSSATGHELCGRPVASKSVTGYTVTFNGWYTASSGGSKVIDSNQNLVANISGYTDGSAQWILSSDKTLYAQYSQTINQYTVTINPNGGTLDGSTSSKNVTMNYGSQTVFDVPTRTGYTFTGWSLSGSGSLFTNTAFGTPLGSYPTFYGTGNDVAVYNNNGNGTVTHAFNSAGSTIPTNSNYYLSITTNGSASPGHGGYYHGTGTAAGKVYYTVIVARIPVGRTIEWASNAYGSGSTATWITGNSGTGDWYTYIFKVACGSSGSFSSTNFYYINGGGSSFSWDVAFTRVYDATGLSSTTTNTPKVFTVGAGNATITANWSINTYTMTNPEGYWVTVDSSSTHATTATLRAYTNDSTSITLTNGSTSKSGSDVSITLSAGQTFSISHTYSTSTVVTWTITRDNTGRNYAVWAYDGYSNGTNTHSGTWTPSSSVSKEHYIREYVNFAAVAKTGISSASVSPSSGLMSVSWGGVPTFTASVSTGYTFRGWYTASDGSGTAVSTSTSYAMSVAPDADYTLYAYATANTYNIYFTAGNDEFDIVGSDSSWSEYTFNTFYYDTVYRISDYITSAPGKTGYTFIGWRVTNNLNTSTAKYGSSSSPSSSVGTSTNIPNSYYIKNLTPTNGATVTLTAQFSVNYYSVTVKYYSFSGRNSTGIIVPNAGTDNTNVTLSSGQSTNYGYSPDGRPWAYGTNIKLTITRANTSYNYYISTTTPTTSSSVDSVTVSFNVTGNITINIYVIQRMKVTLKAGTGGYLAKYNTTTSLGTSLTIYTLYNRSIRVSGKNIWSFGDVNSRDIDAVANSGYTFSSWSVSDNYKITINATITASFASSGKTITIRAGSGFYSSDTVNIYKNGSLQVSNRALTSSSYSITISSGDYITVRYNGSIYGVDNDSDGYEGYFAARKGSSSGTEIDITWSGCSSSGSSVDNPTVRINFSDVSNGDSIYMVLGDNSW